MEEENPLQRDHCLSVVLPGGLEKTTTVHGSKPVLDLLVTLCAIYHLNPSDYTAEILSDNKNISFKPNSLIGSLDADKILLKPKEMEEKIRRPYMPEATVRMLINYRTSHKAVVRVNPRVPLELLMPVICSKCEFDVETTILLSDAQSLKPLDLTLSLNDHALRQVFAKDTAAVTPADVISPPPPEGNAVCIEEPNPPKKEKQEKKQKENKGFFRLFKRGKKKPEMNATVSAPASPGLNERALSLNSLAARSPNTLPADKPQKRRAPQPPMGASLSVPDNLSTHHLKGPQSSADSTLRRTKRRAPPPPCGNSRLEDTEVKGTVTFLHTLQEQRESEQELDSPTPSSPSSPPQPPPSSSSSSSSSPSSSMVHPQEASSPCPPTSPSLGKELCNGGPLALARILTSSLSDGTPAPRLSNSATLPRTHDGSGSSSSSPPPTRPREGSFCSELRSRLGLRPVADSEWQDPRERKGLTTFKVVPARKQRLYDVVLTLERLDLSHTSQATDGAFASGQRTATQEDPGKSPESPVTERPLTSDLELSALVSDVPSFLPPPPTRLEDESRLTSAVPEVEEDDVGETSQVPEVEEDDVGETLQVPEGEEDDVGETLQIPEVEEDDVGETSQIPEGEEDDVGETSQIPEVEEDPEKADGDDSVSATVGSEPLPASRLDRSHGGPIDDANSDTEQQNASTQSPSREPPNTETDQIASETDNGAKVDEIGPEVVERAEEDEDYFPPPPPPVFYDEEEEEKGESASPSCNGQTNGLGGGRLLRLTSPKPYRSPSTRGPLARVGSVPSRFAQAVAQAVQRTQSQSKGQGSLCSTPSSTGPCADTVPEWLPHTSVNGGSCLG